MGARKVGKALEEALAPKAGGQAKPGLKVHTMGGLRLAIFEHLCRFPCLSLSSLSRSVGHSLNTVNWHLRKLLAAGYVAEVGAGSSRVYVPAGLVEKDDVPLLSALNRPPLKRAFLQILENPGSVQRDISSGMGASHQSAGRAMETLEALGLISKVTDGRFARYYPSTLLEARREARADRIKKFKTSVLDRLESEGLKPRVLRSGPAELMVELSKGRETAVLSLALDPFTTVLG